MPFFYFHSCSESKESVGNSFPWLFKEQQLVLFTNFRSFSCITYISHGKTTLSHISHNLSTSHIYLRSALRFLKHAELYRFRNGETSSRLFSAPNLLLSLHVFPPRLERGEKIEKICFKQHLAERAAQSLSNSCQGTWTNQCGVIH